MFIHTISQTPPIDRWVKCSGMPEDRHSVVFLVYTELDFIITDDDIQLLLSMS